MFFYCTICQDSKVHGVLEYVSDRFVHSYRQDKNV